MAKRAKGWSFVKKRGIYSVRFTHQKRRYTVSTRSRDPGEAAEIAARIYADIVTGRVTYAAQQIITPAEPLDTLIAQWIADVESELGDGTDDTYQVYGRHWIGAFATLAGLNPASAAGYSRSRMRSVQAVTVRKELSALRRFVAWLKEKEMIASPIEIHGVPKKATGVKHKQGRGEAAELQPEEVRQLLGALPERSKGILVRARYLFAFETALRPDGTIDKLEPRDWTPFGLRIRAECDKNRWERVVPLSDDARAALEMARSAGGRLLWGSHDLRDTFAQAAEVLGERVPRVTQYSLKHARITHWFEEGASIPAVKFLTGIKQTSTLDRYMRASRKAAEELVRRPSALVLAAEKAASDE